MNSRAFAVFFLCGLWASCESLVLLSGAAAGATALTIGAATVSAPAAAALGVGALAVLKGVLVGKHLKNRNRREVGASEEDVAMEVAVAQQMDSAGCVAKLLCEIESMSAEDLTPTMSSFKTAFEDSENLKISGEVYDLAIATGSGAAREDATACNAVFPKCVLGREDLVAMLDITFSC